MSTAPTLAQPTGGREFSESNPYAANVSVNSVECPVPSCKAKVGVSCNIIDAPHLWRIRLWWATRDAFEDGLAVGREEGEAAVRERAHAALDEVLSQNPEVES